MIKNLQNSEHYSWGDKNDGWHFLQSPELSIIRETIQVGSGEALHYHKKAEQFFYIIEGSASFYLEDDVFVLNKDEGIHVAPNQKHKIKNSGKELLQFLVISRPKSHGDRVNV